VFLPRLASEHNPPISTALAAEIINVYHHTQLVFQIRSFAFAWSSLGIICLHPPMTSFYPAYFQVLRNKEPKDTFFAMGG
jgi:hypothetical protein